MYVTWKEEEEVVEDGWLVDVGELKMPWERFVGIVVESGG